MILLSKIDAFERGLLFRGDELIGVLQPGYHLFLNPFGKRVGKVSIRDPWLQRADLDVIARSGLLGEEARILDLNDNQRALIWVDGRFEAVLTPGLSILWTTYRKVRIEVVEASTSRFEHPELSAIVDSFSGSEALQQVMVVSGQRGLVFVDGVLVDQLGPGLYAFWKGLGQVQITVMDLREKASDISGQEIMTSDRVTLRLNALITYRIENPAKAVAESTQPEQALYRQAQLALREVVGTYSLETLLTEKEKVSADLTGILRTRAQKLGMSVESLGIRDVILPGEMKDLLNRVMEARTASEADLITRRQETAAMRSQANTAKILENNPVLMRLRELEVLEKVSEKAQLTVVLGENGLGERMMKLI